ncbi:hypothetical protein [Nonomuraea typhae]|uniref:Protein kinase domain-containing protein n=1 Tax=Nonomuraea typhae TaxID=2603600 RepID=A0ABW7Z1X0_9ACTN
MDSGILVTDRAEGPTLAEAVRSGGALAPNAVYRLALAVLTALASVHRTGGRHGDLGPHTVVLGEDGPHVLRGMPAGEGGQADDMFAWAALTAFAATGRDPFGAMDERRRYGAADLGALQGELRELAADCLAEEPEHRPRAEEALLRLLGHSGALETVLPDTPPPVRRRPTGLLLTAGGLVIVLAFGALGYLLTPRTTSAAAGTAPASAGPPKAVPTPPPLPAPAGKVTLPNGAGTLFEQPGDQMRVTAYSVQDKNGDSTSYARTPDGSAFVRTGGDNIFTPVSPDNRWMATVNELHILSEERLDVQFTDRATGEKFTVPTVTNPRWGVSPLWSADSKTLLLTMMERDAQVEDAFVRGFILIDVERRSARVVETFNAEDVAVFRKQKPDERGAYFYRWAPGGQIASGYTGWDFQGIRFFDQAGKVVRTLHWVGQPIGQSFFSPSGKYFVTSSCSRKVVATCVWDTETGKRFATVQAAPGYFYSWYDESHLVVGRMKGTTVTIEVADLTGKVLRKLAELETKKDGRADVRFNRS